MTVFVSQSFDIANLRMNIGLFSGTFDPIHKGHLALAIAARERCELGRVYFVPTNAPPHKPAQPVASYFHRYAMTALATEGEKALVPSLLEAPGEFVLHDKKSTKGSIASAPNYSIDTIRKLKQGLKKSDRLFFLIGIDAFKDIGKWRDAESLFSECAFIVASRPGYSLADVAGALPEKLRQPLILSALEEMSPREVGATLGINEAAVRSRTARGAGIARSIAGSPCPFGWPPSAPILSFPPCARGPASNADESGRPAAEACRHDHHGGGDPDGQGRPPYPRPRRPQTLSLSSYPTPFAR